MNEREAARGILLAHGSMAEGVVDAVRQITGIEDALVPLSNRGLSAAGLADEVRKRVGPGITVLFTDLQSGSCSFAAQRLARDLPDIIIITGVNLPMLLDFVMNRTLPPDELVPRLLEKGRAALACSPASLESHADRAASRG